MSSLVSDFLINPVLRQARRFSEVSRSTLAGGGEEELPAAAEAAAVDSDPVDESAADDAFNPEPEPEPSRSRPLSASTEETRVEEPTGAPMVIDGITRDHLGFPLPSRKGRRIPDDDGMRELRKRIQDINARDVPQADKARLMHDALLEGYRASKVIYQATATLEPGAPGAAIWQPSSSPSGVLDSLRFWQNQLGESSQPEDVFFTESDIAPTYAPIRRRKSLSSDVASHGASTPPDAHPPLGCQHYERNVKLQCFTCKKWYTCRFCHDAREDHNLVRKETRNMLCMVCATPQRASDVCVNCGTISAQYYCNICKLWENRQNKPIYHCNDCGICRRGRGIGKDFFHCKTCNACIPTSIETSHKCIERSTDCDCPICGEYMFTSPKPVVFMTCGHSIHKKCYDQHMDVSYKCPICNKSLANMETQFRNLDVVIQAQPMPQEFRETKAVILCNDCSGRCTVPFHWLGLKCSICRSYNTVELQLVGTNAQGLQATVERTEAVSITTLQQPTGAAQARATATGADGLPVPNRRRHSSQGNGLRRGGPDMVARSLPAFTLTSDCTMTSLANDTDSEDEMLGFWGGVHENESESDEEDSDMSDPDDEEEEEDDDDDNEINLIGHR